MKRKASAAGLKGGKPKQKRQKIPPLMKQPNTISLGPERKAIDVSQALLIPTGTATGTISSLLTPIAQGVNDTERIGRKVRLLKMDLRYNAYMASTTTVGSPFRIKIVYDKQANGVAPTAAQVLTTDSMISPNNLDNADRFITLADWYTQPMSVPSDMNESKRLTRKMDLNQIWSAATGTIADITTGSVYLWVWSNGQIATTAGVFSYYCRFRYTDQ